MLEELIRARRFTLDEFTEYVERFARQHAERGTISRRHLDRLVAGGRSDGWPIGKPNAATARLLERIFSVPIDELLSAPVAEREISAEDFRERLARSSAVSELIISGFRDHLNSIRLLDREKGARVAHDAVKSSLTQSTELHAHSLTPNMRCKLAEIVTEFATLAGWQCLDTGQVGNSWAFYERARAASLECEDAAFSAHTSAEAANVLLEIGETGRAVEVLASIRETTARRVSPLLRSWLAAAHGEALAAHGDHAASLRAFDYANAQLPADTSAEKGPYLVLDPVHLSRWRGHALARVGSVEAVAVLTSALAQLDPTFTRAATALHVDLATAYAAQRERGQARQHLDTALATADHIGSRRQLRRIRQLEASLRTDP